MKELTETEKQITDETRCLLVSLDEKQLVTLNTCRVFLYLSRFALRPQMFVGLTQLF
jgi:hypothetical protein